MPPFQTMQQKDFSGGINSVASPYLVGEKQCQRIRNMILNEHGALTTRDGYSVLTTSPDTTDPIIYRSILNTSTGASTPYAIQQAPNQVPTFYLTNTTPWTAVTPGFTIPGSSTPQSVTVINTDIVCNGYETPKQFNGTTLTPITAQAGQVVPPGAQHIAFHLGSLWVWNTAGNTTALDGPSSIRMSDANNPNSWPTANQAFISKDDGQVGMGLASFTIAETGISPTQTLVAFKNFSGYQITGVFGATTFSIQKIKSDMGCIAPRTIQFVSGFGVIRLTHKGFALYNGVDDKIISEEVRPYIFGGLDLTGINYSSAQLSWAAQSQNPPLYIAACPIGGTQLNRVFVYDLVRRAWTICDYPVNFNSLALISTLVSAPVVQAGTSSGGQLLVLFNGATSDNGVPINWSFRTKRHAAQDFMRPTYWRRMDMDLGFLTSPQTASVTATLTGLSKTISRTLTYTGQSLGTNWGSGIWGQFNWSGSTAIDGRQSFDLLRTFPSVQFDISGTGHVVVRGMELQYRQKPPTRQVI